jgi:hypothetical protein
MSLTGFHPLWDKTQIYRPSPTKDVTWKDARLIRGPFLGGYPVYPCGIPSENETTGSITEVQKEGQGVVPDFALYPAVREVD